MGVLAASFLDYAERFSRPEMVGWMRQLNDPLESGCALLERWSGAGGVLESEPADGRQERVSWTPGEDGRVRQLWESSRDAGKTWTVVFDGTYVRRGAR